ncbi:MAG: class I SAM-dependent methyltransferase [Deltaproteobacteria bacterium]|nr:class I SAM-dependent methyltransferase [Deltaproteobacteria bacterium]
MNSQEVQAGIISSWDQRWDRIYQQQERDKYPSENVIRFMARNYYRVEDRKAVRVLDLGCGGGNNIWYLAREGFSACGIEGSMVAVARAKKRLSAEGLVANLQVADLVQIPYVDDCFDAVIDRGSIMHNKWNHIVQIFGEVYRILRPGGKLLSIMASTNCSEYSARGRFGGQEIERHTFEGFKDSTFEGLGIVHLFDEEEIKVLMRPFRIYRVGYEERIESMGWQESVKWAQWVVMAQK